MTDWTAFSGLLGVVLVLLLTLARLSQGAVTESTAASVQSQSRHFSSGSSTRSRPGSDHHGREALAIHSDNGDADQPSHETARNRDHLSTGVLLVNVALSQGLFALVLVAGAWYTSIPPTALGIDVRDPASVGPLAIAVGILTGLALYAANAIGAASATVFGYEYEEQLRDLLTPETPTGWLLLLCGVLPIIASFEELLFRGALIGVLSAGFDISPWFLAGGSSVAFAFGHGAQGRLGILVTGVLGFVLAAVFVHTHSLLAVIIAHYLVNALEFLVGGAVGINWGDYVQ